MGAEGKVIWPGLGRDGGTDLQLFISVGCGRRILFLQSICTTRLNAWFSFASDFQFGLLFFPTIPCGN